VKCAHCGWDFARPLPERDQPTYNGKNLPPLPKQSPHPHGSCPSPFKVGDEICWDGGGRSDDLAPIRGHFVATTEFYGPSYELEPNGTWLEVEPALPTQGVIEIDKSSVFLEHLEIFGDGLVDEAVCYPVNLHDLESAHRWPTVVVP
jgi:hypothetical protein